MYNKLFTKILDSSVWLEDTTTRIVWLTIIAAMDEDGIVQFASVANLAHRARVTLDEAEAALAILEGPDPHSADPDNEGRRLERIPGGWLVLNAHKYRAMVSRVIIQEQTRERMRKHRERKGAVVEKQEPKTDCYSAHARALVHYLNEKTGAQFREMDSSLAPIDARLKEPDVTIEGCKKMIDRQAALWKDDPIMQPFLRPSTLFRPSKFAEYYALRDVEVKVDAIKQAAQTKARLEQLNKLIENHACRCEQGAAPNWQRRGLPKPTPADEAAYKALREERANLKKGM